MKNKKEAVVLLSGGLDSSVTLYLAKEQGFRCRCLIFDYGQRHKKEIESAKRIAKIADCKAEVVKIELPHKTSALLDKKIAIPKQLQLDKIPATYVPARNTIFLSFAVSLAEAIGSYDIFIGANAVDFSGYPDCRPEFFQAFNKIISVGTKSGAEKKKIEIKTPLINKTKAQIIKLGALLGVPFELTWSCYRGGKQPCGKCDCCYFRAKGFREAGIKDPLIKI